MFAHGSEIERIFNTMDMLQARMNRMFPRHGQFAMPASWDVGGTGPRTNLYNHGDHLEMKIEVPGIAKEDLQLKIQGNYLELSGTRKADAPEGYSAHRVERGSTSFTRSFTLPADVDAARVEAHLKNGLLTLTLPKVEEAKPKQITIN